MTRTYFAPDSVEEAVWLLGEHPETVVVAGGTDLVVGARQGKRELPSGFIAIQRLADLHRLEVDSGGALHAGALVTHSDLERSPLVREYWTALSDAAALVGSPATRHVGTLGGNLVNASPAMELGSPLLIYEAEVELRGLAGTRRLPLAALLVSPGQTSARRDEVLTRVRVPAPPAGCGSAYFRLEYRRAMEIAIVGAAALISLDDGTITDGRLALTAVAPTCIRIPAAEEALRGAPRGPEALARAAELAGEEARPISDVRATERYRRALVPVIARRALEIALRRACGEAVPVPANRSYQAAV